MNAPGNTLDVAFWSQNSIIACCFWHKAPAFECQITTQVLTKDSKPFAVQKAVQVPSGLRQGWGLPSHISLSPSVVHQVTAIHSPHTVVTRARENPQLIPIDSSIMTCCQLWGHCTPVAVTLHKKLLTDNKTLRTVTAGISMDHKYGLARLACIVLSHTGERHVAAALYWLISTPVCYIRLL